MRISITEPTKVVPSLHIFEDDTALLNLDIYTLAYVKECGRPEVHTTELTFFFESSEKVNAVLEPLCELLAGRLPNNVTHHG